MRDSMATLIDVAPDALVEARLAGSRQAEAFDQSLRKREWQEREDRLAGLAGGGDEEPSLRHASSEQLHHLERQVETLASFHRAVMSSRGWQMLQAMRRLMGRAW
jgi:hypothetical protein